MKNRLLIAAGIVVIIIGAVFALRSRRAISNGRSRKRALPPIWRQFAVGRIVFRAVPNREICVV
jgi:hypothetical protein